MENKADPKDQLRRQFEELVLRYTNDVPLVYGFWTEIETKYSRKLRHYHNLHHLENLLELLIEVKPLIKDWDVTLFALFYHDLVYNPVRRDNEEKSAQCAEKRLESINFPKSGIDKCVKMILATAGHADAGDDDINLFTDADLAILGCDPARYTGYTEQVRKEYRIYPDILYKPGRRKVLQHFLNMERIFKTDYFYNKFETLARKNLNSELMGL